MAELAEIAVVERPQRWDNPFDPNLNVADVEWVLRLDPFRDMDESRFPRTASLRDIIRNDSRIVRYRSGEIVVRAGDYGSSVFLVMEGSVRVVISPPLPESTLGHQVIEKNGVFGALSQLWGNSPIAEYRDRSGYDRGMDAAGAQPQDQFTNPIQDIRRIVDEHQTAPIEAGDMFGELAAMGRTSRTSTVISETDTVLLELRWQGFRDIRLRNVEYREHTDRLYRERGLEAHLRQTPLLDHLGEDDLRRLAVTVAFEDYGTFEWHSSYKTLTAMPFDERLKHEPVIVNAGDYPESLLLVRNGFCRVTEKLGAGERTITYLGHGASFGLEELAHNWLHDDEVPYQRNLRAVGYVDLLVVPIVAVQEIILASLPPDKLPRRLAAGPDRDVQLDTLFDDSELETGMLEFLVENRFINGTATMVIDTDRCVRCDDCVRACADAHDGNPRFIRHGKSHGRLTIANACMHCADPVCMIGCPTGAIHRSTAEGQVVINDATCIGCGTCANSCPYNNIRMVEIRDGGGNYILDRQTNVPLVQATKCDLCVDQLGGPACQRACPHDALRRVDMGDLSPNLKWLIGN